MPSKIGSSQFKNIAFISSLAIIYFIAGKLGLSLAFINPSASPIWPPTGISLAAFLIWGYRIWPAVFIGAFSINITTAGTFFTSLGIAAGNTLEGVVGAYLVRRFITDENIFSKPINIFLFTFLAGIVSTMVSATFGVTTLSLGGLINWVNYWPVWMTWWLGDMGGALIVTPVLLLWRLDHKVVWQFTRVVEAIAVSLLLILICQLIFVEQIPIAISHPMAFIAPPLIWIAFRFGPRETAAIILVLSLITILSTLGYSGPFVREDPNQALLVVQVFMGIIFITFMPLTTATLQQKQVEEKLREKEEHYRALVDTANDAIITIDEKSKILFCNPVVQNIFGYDQDELIGKDLTILMPDYIRNVYNIGLSRYVESRRQNISWAGREIKGLHKNGNEIFLEVSYGKIQKNGSSTFIGFIRDLTNKKTVEETLLKVQEKFRLAVDHFPSTFIIYDPERRIQFINKEGLRLTGYKEEDILNKRDEEIFPPELTNNYIPLLKECIRTATLQKNEFTVNLPNGTYTFLDYYVPVLDKEGNIDQVVGICHDVSSHKRAEETKTLLASIVESSYDAIIGKTLDGTIVSWNCGAERIYGYKAEETLGKSITLIIPPDKIYELNEFHDKVVRGEKIQQHETMRVRKDGTEFHVSLTISPIKDSYGKIVGASIIEHDITSYKRAEETKTLLASIVESSHDAIIGKTLDGTIVSWNSGAERIYGYKAEEIIGKSITLVIPPEKMYELNGFHDEVVRGEKIQQHETTRVRKDGTVFHVSLTISPIKDSYGKIIGASIIEHDITSHKRAEETKTLLATIVESSQDAIIGKALDGTILSWNKGAEQIYGYSANEVIGENISIIIPTELSREREEYLKKIMRGVKIKLFETERIRKDGERLHISLAISPLMDSQGKIIGVSTVERDITAPKIASQQLENSLKEKEILLKEIHHRVKNNLQIISSLLNLQSHYITDKRALSVFIESQNRIRTMALVHEKLYQSQDLLRIDFAGYVRDLASNLFKSYTMNMNQTNFRMNIENIFINVDTIITLGLIINELVTNSLKHAFCNTTADGEIFVSFVKREPNILALSVADTGEGLPENFDIRNTESLGLRLVTTLVDQLSGNIEAKRNKGTEFVITFTQ